MAAFAIGAKWAALLKLHAYTERLHKVDLRACCVTAM